MKPRDWMEILFGAGIGAAAMYVLDPEAGDKRRAAIKEQALQGLATTGAAASAAWEATADSVRHARADIAAKYQDLRESDLIEQVRHLGYSRRKQRTDWSAGLGWVGAALGAAALGAGIMFLLDPAQGQVRRSLIKSRSRRMAHQARGYLQNPLGRSGHATGHVGDMPGRAEGLTGLAASDHLRGQSGPHFEAPAGSDEELAARVRQEIATLCTRPMDVYVTSRSGLVNLSGSLPIDEQARIINRIQSLPGVIRVDNNLTTSNPVGTEL